MHLYQWGDRVVRMVVRPDWKVRNGNIAKTAHMIVTPAVTVSFFVITFTVCLKLFMFCSRKEAQIYYGLISVCFLFVSGGLYW